VKAEGISMQRLKFSAFILALVILMQVSCKKDQVKDSKNGGKDPVSENNHKINKKYLNEGFISRNIFRSVIIATREECEEGTAGIEEKSRNRAFTSLQKYIQSTGNYSGGKTKASLLNLINQNGRFIPLKRECSKNNVYYYDIEKKNIKGHLKRISIR
jgi:hypothetical protein